MKIRPSAAAFLVCIFVSPAMIVGCQGNLWSSFQDVNQVNFSPIDSIDESQPTVKVYNEPHDLLVMLHEMEKVRNNRWQAQQGWWHGQKKMISQMGDLHGVNMEWWFRFNGIQPCPELIQIIYGEDGRILENNVLVCESDLSKLETSLPTHNVENPPNLVKIPDQSRPELLELTLDRIENMLSDPNQNSIESTEAIIRAGNLYITVIQAGPIRDMLMVTIDLDTGFILEETNRIYALDDNELLGEIIYQYHFNFYDQLPLEIQNQLDWAFNS